MYDGWSREPEGKSTWILLMCNLEGSNGQLHSHVCNEIIRMLYSTSHSVGLIQAVCENRWGLSPVGLSGLAII